LEIAMPDTFVDFGQAYMRRHGSRAEMERLRRLHDIKLAAELETRRQASRLFGGGPALPSGSR